MPMELDIKRTVKKSNILNEMRNANASMAEYRLFCVYLAHLPMNSDDNRVTFSLADYARIAGLDRPRHADIKAQAENIVGTTATLPNDDGGFTVYSLFSDFKLHREDEQWMVSLECNPKIAPMIREQKGRFLRYKLYNTIFLKSYNQQRIYELLKQYQKIGVRTERLEDLRAFLSIGKNEYPVWGVFSRDVLKVAQKALSESTDISFEYEPVKKGKKVVAVKFIINQNDAFKDVLKLEGFFPEGEFEYDGGDIEVSATLEELEEQAEERRKICAGFEDEIFAEFTLKDLETLRSLAWHKIDPEVEERHFMALGDMLVAHQYAVADYISRKILLCNSSKKPVPYRLGFIRKAVEEDWR